MRHHHRGQSLLDEASREAEHPPVLQGVDLGALGSQQVLVGGDELQIGGGGGIVVALQLRQEV